mmetsp:Transcript_22061/g.55623  ORF Transcript_22061/g.55623 Transcript_22061/m.55623 type:complete len:241 (-) Transcript_22061:583-1305(-)
MQSMNRSSASRFSLACMCSCLRRRSFTMRLYSCVSAIECMARSPDPEAEEVELVLEAAFPLALALSMFTAARKGDEVLTAGEDTPRACGPRACPAAGFIDDPTPPAAPKEAPAPPPPAPTARSSSISRLFCSSSSSAVCTFFCTLRSSMDSAGCSSLKQILRNWGRFISSSSNSSKPSSSRCRSTSMPCRPFFSYRISSSKSRFVIFPMPFASHRWNTSMHCSKMSRSSSLLRMVSTTST